MANANLNRLAQVQPRLRLFPPEPLPDSFIRRFPELKDWQVKNQEIWKKNEELLAQQLAIAQTAGAG